MAEARSDLDEALRSGNFDRVWELADWVFKSDRQDAQYWFMLGQRSEMLKSLVKAG